MPLTPGVHSALGLLMSDVKHDYVRSKLVGLEDLDLTEINHMFHQLIERAKADLMSEGFTDEEIKIEPYLDLRYAGQGYELTVPSPMPPYTQDDLTVMRGRFDTMHEQNSGHKAESEPVELVSLRLISLGLVPQAKLSPGKVTGRKVEAAKTRRTQSLSSAKSMACSPPRCTIATCSSPATKSPGQPSSSNWTPRR